MGSPVEHFSSVIGPYAGVHSQVHDEEGNQEKASERHDKFLADGGSQEFGPLHVDENLKDVRKISTGMLSKSI
jgi:hypothetical protein